MTELKTNTRTWLFAGALLLAGIANLLSSQKRLQMQALRASTKSRGQIGYENGLSGGLSEMILKDLLGVCW